MIGPLDGGRGTVSGCRRRDAMTNATQPVHSGSRSLTGRNSIAKVGSSNGWNPSSLHIAAVAMMSRISSAKAQPNGPRIICTASVTTAIVYADRTRVGVSGGGVPRLAMFIRVEPCRRLNSTMPGVRALRDYVRRGAVDFSLEALPAVAAAALRLIQRRVGPLQDPFDPIVVSRRLRDTDAARAAHFACFDRDDEALARGANAFGDTLGGRQRCFGRDQREFLAAQAADDVRLPALRTQHVGEAAEQEVAGIVAETVVNALEEIEVDDQHAERAAVALEPRELGTAALEPRSPRVQIGERIGTDQTREMIARVLQVADLSRETRLQSGRARADLDAGAELLGVDRLDHVVVGAGVESGDEIGAARACGQQQHVHPGELRVVPDAPADLDAIDTRHHPVENRQLRDRARRQQAPC